MIRTLILIAFLFQVFAAHAQKTLPDSVSSVNKRANRAALMSAVIPGLGQAYNKKYWKIPILYAGIGTLVYFSIDNNDQYKKYKQAYVYRLDGDSTTNDTQYPNLSDEDILARKDYYRRNRDLCYVILGAVYVLNIIDAYVDAHLKDFDVSDNLSLQPRPFLNITADGTPVAGAGVCLKFR